MTADAVGLVRAHPFFAGLADAHVLALAGCAREASFPAGATIFTEGDAANDFFLIRSGGVALQTASPDRPPATFQTLRDGDFVGVSWVAPPYRWSFDAQAAADVEAIAFDARCLRGKCEVDNSLGYELMLRFVPALIERLTAARLQALDLYGSSP